MLELSKIKTHEASQAREEINESKIAEYAEHITNGGSFPPIIVFYDSTNYWLADGWHRLIATKRVGCLTILEEVHVGGQRDALKYALGANSKHGLPRTNADKRKAVGIALNDAEWSKLPTREIAEMCNVSHTMVAELQKPAKKDSNLVNVYKNDPEVKVKSEESVNVYKEIPVSSKVEPEYDPVEHELSEAHSAVIALSEENTKLKDAIAVGNLPESEQSAGEIITQLRAKVKILEVTLAAVTVSRDSFQRENNQMNKQIEMQRKEIAKLKGK